MKIIKNPITNHLPSGCLKIGKKTKISFLLIISTGTSTKARLVKMNEFVDKLPQNAPIAFIVGAVAVGNPGFLIFMLN